MVNLKETLREMILDYIKTLKDSGNLITTGQVELLKAMMLFYSILL